MNGLQDQGWLWSVAKPLPIIIILECQVEKQRAPFIPALVWFSTGLSSQLSGVCHIYTFKGILAEEEKQSQRILISNSVYFILSLKYEIKYPRKTKSQKRHYYFSMNATGVVISSFYL